MAGRILFEVFIFSIPFILFGLYLAATADAEHDGRRKWPINILFLMGLGLATLAWFVLIMLEDKSGTICKEPNRYENGKIIEGKTYPCEHNNADAGRPLSTDPGGSAEKAGTDPDGVPDPDPRTNDPN